VAEQTNTMARLPAAEARTLAVSALLGAGALAEVAELVAAHVVDAELAGHPSHGLRQIPLYCGNAGAPGNDLTVTPEIIAATPALTTVDAREGLGHPALAVAVDAAAAAARRVGIAASAVVRCGHAGRAGAWVERGAGQGSITIVLLGGTTPPFAMAATPGAAPALHTNPIAIAAPATGAPLLLDIATSVVAAGRVPVALARGLTLPEGSIATVEGTRSGDPAEIDRGGSLLPVGGHKGFGLSALIEALSVSLTGADRAGRAPHEGALAICIDAGAFRPSTEVAESLDALRMRLRGSSGPDAPVLAPGDPETSHRFTAKQMVDVEHSLVAELSALARRMTPREDARA